MPESKRDSLFAFVSDAEVRRLDNAFADIKTLDDAIARFGPPDEDIPHGVSVRTPEEREKPSVSDHLE